MGVKPSDGKAGFLMEIVGVLLASWWTVVAGSCFGLAGGMVAMKYLPKTYSASTKFLVTPPQIPQEFVRSTVTDIMAARLATIQESMLSRPYMIKLIEQTFGRPGTEKELDMMIGRIKRAVSVAVTRYPVSQNTTALIFELSYLDSDPKRAAQVVNTLTTLFMEENNSFRTLRAEETTKMIGTLGDSARIELTAKEKLIADYKEQHLYETPEQLDANVKLLESRNDALESSQKSLEAASDRLQLLQSQAQAAAAGSSVTSAAIPGADPSTQRLALLQRELEGLRSRYLEDHPEVRAKKREIEDLQAGMRAAGATDPEASGSASTPPGPFDMAIRAQDREIVRLGEEQKRIRADIAIYSARVEATPRVQLHVAELTKGYDALLAQYNDYQRKVRSARGAQTIEEAEKGEQFNLIQEAVPPTVPVRPVALIVLMAGLGAGLVLFVGPVLAKAVLLPVVRSEEVIGSWADVPVLVSIPRISTPQTISSDRRTRVKNIVGAAVSCAVLAVSVLIFH